MKMKKIMIISICCIAAIVIGVAAYHNYRKNIIGPCGDITSTARLNFEKIEVSSVGTIGKMYSVDDNISISFKSGYYIEDALKANIEIPVEKECVLLSTSSLTSGKRYENLEYVDLSDSGYVLKNKKDKPRQKVECLMDLPFENMQDTGEIYITIAPWAELTEDGTYQLLCSCRWDDGATVKYEKVEADSWDECYERLNYVKTDKKILFYKKKNIFVKARIFFMSK